MDFSKKVEKTTADQALIELLRNVLTDYKTRRDSDGLLPDGTSIDADTMRKNERFSVGDYAVFAKQFKD